MSLEIAPGTQALLDLEDARPDVLFHTVEGMGAPLWAQVRSAFAHALNELDYGLPDLSTPNPSRASAWRGVAEAFMPTRWDSARARGRGPLTVLVGGTTVHDHHGSARNWLVGHVLDEEPTQAALLQWAPLPSPVGPPHFSRTWSLAPVQVRAAAYARLSRRDPSREVEPVIHEIHGLLGSPLAEEQMQRILHSAVYHQRTVPHILRHLDRVLDRLQPRVVLMEDGSYGTWAELIVRLKERGVQVAEPQHGWIGPTHAAYNYGAAWDDSRLRRCLPDALLTFGEYWSRGLRYPAALIPLGKPHLEAAAGHLSPPNSRHEILIASSTIDAAQTVAFARDLRAKLDRRWTVVFRPHPSERATAAERYGELSAMDGVEIDSRSDVYESLARAAVVVGMASTVLFEARAFGCAVVVRASSFTDRYVGDAFGPVYADSEAAEIAQRIDSGEVFEARDSVPMGEMWAPESRTAWSTWVAQQLSS